MLSGGILWDGILGGGLIPVAFKRRRRPAIDKHQRRKYDYEQATRV
jgi:hypothetical protein